MDSLTAFNPLTVVTGIILCCVVAVLAALGQLELPRISRGRVALILSWLGLTWLLWVSDYPAAWRVPELVEYLATVTFSAFRFLIVTATGTLLFGSLVALLYLTRPKRR